MAATIRDIVDDQGSWAAIVTELAAADLDEVAAAERLARYFDAPVEELPLLFTLEDYVPGALELRERLRSVIESLVDGRRALPVHG
jgi:hypothetical protein